MKKQAAAAAASSSLAAKLICKSFFFILIWQKSECFSFLAGAKKVRKKIGNLKRASFQSAPAFRASNLGNGNEMRSLAVNENTRWKISI